jgi:hypothetical protein
MFSGLERPEVFWVLPVAVLLWVCSELMRPETFLRKGSIVSRSTLATHIARVFRPSSILKLLVIVSVLFAIARPFAEFAIMVVQRLETRVSMAMDNSSSVVSMGAPTTLSVLLPIEEGLTCSHEELATIAPLVDAQCKAVMALVDAIERAGSSGREGADGFSQEQVSIVRFADDAIVTMPFTSNYDGVRTALGFDWRGGLGTGSTNVNDALALQIALALERNSISGGGLTFLTAEEGNEILRALSSLGGLHLSVDAMSTLLREKLSKIALEMHDTIFIVITDGVFFLSAFDKKDPSLRKVLELLSLLNIAVHVVATSNADIEVVEMVEETGFGVAGSPSRGSYTTGASHEELSGVVERILRGREELLQPTTSTRKETHSVRWMLIALALFLLWLFLRELYTRPITE